MKNLATLTFILIFVAGCSDSSTLTSSLEEEGPLARSGQNKIDVCHYDADADEYFLINIAEPALKAHIAQGGGVPGGDVPGLAYHTFDEACQPQTIYTIVDFNEASQTVGDGGTTNQASVWDFNVNLNGLIGGAGVSLTDDSNVPGYSWEGNTYLADGGSTCRYQIVSIRARAELNGDVERIDFDGYSTNPYGHLSSPWDLLNGDRPTLIVESMVIDQNARTCS